MDKFLFPNPSSKRLQQISDEFLETLLQEEILYPWNPFDVETEAYLAQQELDISLADILSTEEIRKQIQFLNQVFENSSD